MKTVAVGRPVQSSRPGWIRSWLESDRWLWFLAIAGTLLRFALITMTRHQPTFYDELDYDKIGTSIAQGLGFRIGGLATAYRPPGQPMLMGMIYSLFGHHPLTVKILEALMLAILPFVCARIGRALGLSALAANLGATLAAFHPALAYASTTLYPTVLTATAVTLGVWLCWLAMKRNSPVTAVAAGITLAIAAAATSTFAPAAFLAALVIGWNKRFKIAALVLIVGMAPAVAWMVRNKIVMDDFAIATNGGQNLELGANDEATPRSGNWIEAKGDPSKGEVHLDRQEQELAKQWIRLHPGRYAELAVLRSLAVFDSEGKPRTTEGLHASRLAHIAAWSLLPIMIFGVFGLIVYWRHSLTWLTMAVLGLVILSSAATIAKPRFRFPCDPLLCVFAIAGAARLTEVKPRPEQSSGLV